MDIIRDIREKQNQLIVMINSTFDEIIKELEGSIAQESNCSLEYESFYPITNTTGFKGKKPIAVIFKEHRDITPTWKAVIQTILGEILKEPDKKIKILALRDKLLGRKRKRLSSTSEDMKSPLKLADNLYIETHYDTETLMNLLLQILNEISYDYSSIQIVIKN